MEEILKKYSGRIMPTYQRVNLALHRHRVAIYRIAFTISAVLFVVITLYAGYKASNYFPTDSDALIATQQFSGSVLGNTVALPGSHTNILMIPLLYVQGHLPYHLKSFTALNVLLVFATIAAWAILLIRLFGRKYQIPILLLLASLVFSSATFNLSIANTTFRNISYPIALWFVVMLGQVLRSVKRTRLFKAEMIVSCVLFCLVLAGDSFFSYAVLLPILVVLGWYWLRTHILTKAMFRSLGLIAAVVVGASLIKFILGALKFIYFDNSFLTQPAILPSSHLGPSIQIMLSQLMDLQGGYIFGRTISLGSLGTFVNLGILIVGIIGLVAILRRADRAYRSVAKNSLTKDDNFVLATMALSFFIVMLEYVISGYVVTQLGNGTIISYLNARYITLLPLIVIIGFVWLLKNRYNGRRDLVVILSLVLLVGILTGYSATHSAYATAYQDEPVPSKASVNQLIAILSANQVHKIVTDFWYGPPIQFWSSSKITYAPQVGCNQALPFDSRKDWFAQKQGKSALLIDRGGLNYGYWSCTDQQLVQIYGKPVKQISVPGIQPGEVVNIWIYNYDTSQRLAPFPGSTR